MGDVAQILSGATMNKDNKTTKQNLGLGPPPPPPPSHQQPKALQATAIPRPVMKILSGNEDSRTASLPPIVPNYNVYNKFNNNNANNANTSSNTTRPNSPTVVKINNKFIYSNKKCRSWVWAPFSSSARNDGLLLHHWVRAGVEYPDYPYARFDIHLEPLSYRNFVRSLQLDNDSDLIKLFEASKNDPQQLSTTTTASTSTTSNNKNLNTNIKSVSLTSIENEDLDHLVSLFYNKYLQHDNWTQSETDTLLELCRIHELRWPVIIDRWVGLFGGSEQNILSNKKVYDLQHRYYSIGMILNRKTVEKVAKVEADHLAKALATTTATSQATIQQQPGVSITGGKSPGKTIVANTVSALNPVPSKLNTTSVQPSTDTPMTEDNKVHDTLAAEHALANAIATSSSDAISAMVGDVEANMQPHIPSLSTGTSNQPVFDIDEERNRRRIMEMIWSRSKEDELEEEELRKELKMIEAQIRKLKKSGRHILAASSSVPSSSGVPGSSTYQAVSGQGPSYGRGMSPVPGANTDTESSFAMLDAQFASTAPQPTSGTPYLQSGRLNQPATGGHLGINKTTLKNMDLMLKELCIPERPLPTKRVCDLYDHVRKGVLTLLTLQKVMLKKESEAISRRAKLEKIAGTAHAKEIANTLANTAPVVTKTVTTTSNANRVDSSSKAKVKASAAEKSSKSGTNESQSTKTANSKGTSKRATKSTDGSKKRKTSPKKTTGNTSSTTSIPTPLATPSLPVASLTQLPVTGINVPQPTGFSPMPQPALPIIGKGASSNNVLTNLNAEPAKSSKKRARKN